MEVSRGTSFVKVTPAAGARFHLYTIILLRRLAALSAVEFALAVVVAAPVEPETFASLSAPRLEATLFERLKSLLPLALDSCLKLAAEFGRGTCALELGFGWDLVVDDCESTLEEEVEGCIECLLVVGAAAGFRRLEVVAAGGSFSLSSSAGEDTGGSNILSRSMAVSSSSLSCSPSGFC